MLVSSTLQGIKMLFVVLFLSAFLAADGEILRKDLYRDSKVCEDKNDNCPRLKNWCKYENHKALRQMCKETCGLCKARNQCPADHPFAYNKGTLCCKSNQEDIYPQLGESCDGSELSTCSRCCKDNKYVVCPHGKCETNAIAGKNKVPKKAQNLCPADHPYPYSKGTYCCKYNKESIFPQFGVNCDGSELSPTSVCCKDNKFVKCPHGKCAKNKAPSVCPKDHPYAYSKGTYCCKYNKENIFPQFGVNCDGSEISPTSVCCKDNKFVKCPHGKCATNPALNVCPGDHPFAYFKGMYCCKYNKESVYPQLGAGCDGSKISSASMCCKDNEFVACPRGKCSTNTKPKAAGTCELLGNVGKRFQSGIPYIGDSTFTIKCSTKVTGFRVRDWTSYRGFLYGIQLRCADGTTTAPIEGYTGGRTRWGYTGGRTAWKGWKTCGNGDFVTGFNFRRLNRGSYMDGSNIKMRCSKGKEIEGQSTNIGQWGFSGYQKCPKGQYFCGTKVWAHKNSGYTLHKFEFLCCGCKTS